MGVHLPFRRCHRGTSVARFANNVPRRRDIVVVGSSAGGIETVRTLLSVVDRVDASIFIVQHGTTGLVELLHGGTPLRVKWGEQGDAIERGTIYVAPPDVHMELVDDHIGLSAGPRESYSRPSIDRLFKSAATRHGSRVVGVLLTGTLADGVAGLVVIRRLGGLALVEDPRTAVYPDLPQAAIDAGAFDQIAGVEDLGRMIADLTRQPAPESPPAPDATAGAPNDQSAVERALWSAVQLLRERSETLDTLARDARAADDHPAAGELETRAGELRRQLALLREMVVGMRRP
jgi:two-component system chemotaxis response regulator CheB